MEVSEDVRTCRGRTSAGDGPVDRKLDILSNELRNFYFDVAGVQETCWFGNYVWPVSGGGVFLHTGRALPGEGEPRRRKGGEGLLLNAKATELWRLGGEQWKAISSRIVTARILLGAKGYKIRQDSNLKGRSDFFVTFVSAYAPTSKATPVVKDRVFSATRSVFQCMLGQHAT